MHTPTRKNNTESGFTIVEVLVSLIIFSIAVAGVITVAAQGGLGVNTAKNKLEASYLADEGIELMRGMRDTSVLMAGSGSESVGWASFYSVVTGSYCGTGTACDIIVANPTATIPFPQSTNFVPCTQVAPLDGTCQLFMDSTGYYTDSDGSGDDGALAPTLFNRGIVVRSLSADEVEVIVTIKWKEGSAVQTISESENLYNWYD
jgi:prepilin-type N-terminal cleavage/methylation domain-containing protein